jgi:hypothetical protein
MSANVYEHRMAGELTGLTGMTGSGPKLPLEIAKTTTATDNEPDIHRFDVLCVHEEKLKTMAATPFYKRTCHVVISHDNLRSGCKTFSGHYQQHTRSSAALHPEGREFETLRAHHKFQGLKPLSLYAHSEKVSTG